MLVQDKQVPQAAIKISCVICHHTGFNYAFRAGKNTFLQCEKCHAIVPEKEQSLVESAAFEQSVNRDSDALVKLILDAISDRVAEKPYLVIAGVREGSLSGKLKCQLPLDTVYASPEEGLLYQEKKFGAVIVLTPISMVGDVNHFFDKIRSTLKTDGCLFVLQPMIDSSQAKLMKTGWLEWSQPHAFYATRDALHILLLNEGFDRVWFRKARYLYSLDYISRRFRNEKSGFMAFLVGLAGFLPGFMRKIKFKLPSSHIIVTSQMAMPKIGKTLSVILPVFNEKNTFDEMIQVLLAKTIDGLRKEIIIVESNSADGTRELVKKYENHPDVRVIWQQQARGKGFAVREGLAAATGDYVLIQDADLEYDIDDYESLLAPLQDNQAMFVLGSRHTGTWRMREFNDAAATAAVFNLGHLFFTWFVNLLTRQRMTDPFTMFKVFRRDVLFGIDFICKRFDFDHEMVIKFIRKGYQPLELPVNYRARSFAEGKKVSFIKDGLFWITTDLKLRFGRLGRWSQ